MKREIKFRGKSIRSDKWCYGSLSIYEDECDIAGYDVFGEGIYDWRDETVDPDTVGQYTGLRDKNGKEIYEGDIVTWMFFRTICSFNGAGDEHEELLKGVIEWRQGGFIFRVLTNDFEQAGWYAISDLHTETRTDVKIIGNIHDNPELLTEK